MAPTKGCEPLSKDFMRDPLTNCTILGPEGGVVGDDDDDDGHDDDDGDDNDDDGRCGGQDGHHQMRKGRGHDNRTNATIK